MKEFIGKAATFTAGMLTGFYLCKYSMLKVLLKNLVKNEEKKEEA